ncbi:MAG TPA: R3H domain-containing nucleic acid-binding protein [Candidatus Polarisedimenticolia bacterium]|nr:R3H domain-containing nucleic acid-binding protein [Candidatus Polarisedimenticolia bacterium]
MDRRHDIEELARRFLDAMKLSLTASVTEEPDSFQVDLGGPDAYLLLERKGGVLDALQLVMGKVAEARLQLDKRLVVDCEGYRKGRDAELVQIALSAADKVRKLRQPMELAPMNPYERRLVHLALAEQEGVASASQGDGFLKRILITPA